MNGLQKIMNYIASTWKCDSKRYPALYGMDQSQRKIFLVKHSLLHLNKHLGNIAAVCEDYDHTATLFVDSDEKLRKETTKMFVSTLKLAEELGMTVQELLERAPALVK